MEKNRPSVRVPLRDLRVLLSAIFAVKGSGLEPLTAKVAKSTRGDRKEELGYEDFLGVLCEVLSDLCA